ncbi:MULTISPECIES: recombination protein NinG [unclassified Carboxylicivirga]|uniref:recombination protein NinG n=1 Tax=Carboxylicivirga TaxID=1628153 RepID=UPI003D34F4E1
MHVSDEIIARYAKKTNQWLDKELWRLMSLWVRQQNTDDNGVGRCVTCGAYRQWRSMDAGHYMSRRHKITKFHPQNVHPQCKRCNGPEGGGEPEKMARYIDRLYGPGTAQHLQALSKLSHHWSRFDYIELIEKYKSMLSKLNYELR